MRYFLMAGVAVQLLALPVFAQTAPMSTAPTSTPPASTATMSTSPGVSGQTGATQSSDGGLAGANSFTENQARSRLEKDGFVNVSALVKDNNGVWRGRATKGSAEHNVGVDYKGNIVSN